MQRIKVFLWLGLLLVAAQVWPNNAVVQTMLEEFDAFPDIQAGTFVQQEYDLLDFYQRFPQQRASRLGLAYLYLRENELDNAYRLLCYWKETDNSIQQDRCFQKMLIFCLAEMDSLQANNAILDRFAQNNEQENVSFFRFLGISFYNQQDYLTALRWFQLYYRYAGQQEQREAEFFLGLSYYQMQEWDTAVYWLRLFFQRSACMNAQQRWIYQEIPGAAVIFPWFPRALFVWELAQWHLEEIREMEAAAQVFHFFFPEHFLHEASARLIAVHQLRQGEQLNWNEIEQHMDMEIQFIGHFQQQNWEEMKAIFDQLDDPDPYLLLLAGEAAYAQKAYRKSFFLFQRAFVQEAEFFAAWGAAHSALKVKDYASSARFFQAVLDHEPDERAHERAVFFLAYTSFYSKNFEQAKTYFDNYLQLNNRLENDHFVHYFLGRIALQNEDTETALAIFQKLPLEMDRLVDKVKFYWLGETYFKMNKFANAIEYYQRFIDAHQESNNLFLDEARFQLEKAWYKLGKYNAQTEFVLAFCEKYPDSPRVSSLYWEVGNQFLEENREVEGKAVFQRLIEADSIYAEKVDMCLAEYYQTTEQWEKVLPLLDTGLPIPGEPVFYALANQAYQAKQYSDALNYISDARAHGWESFRLQLLTANSFKASLQIEEMMQLLEEVEQQYPDSLRLHIVEVVGDLVEFHFYEKALSMIEAHWDALSLEPQMQLLHLQADIYWARMEYQAVESTLTQLAEKGSDFSHIHARALYRLGLLYLEQDQPTIAKNWLEKLLQQYPYSEFVYQAEEYLQTIP